MVNYYVTADWQTLVPEGDPRAAFGVQARDLKRLGLTPPDGDVVEDSPEPVVMVSANLLEPVTEPEAPVSEPEPEAKEAPKPANKAAPKPANKGAARKDPADGDRN